MIRFDDILEKVASWGHLSEKDIILLKKAYVLLLPLTKDRFAVLASLIFPIP